MAKRAGGEREMTFCKAGNIEPALMRPREAADYLKVAYATFNREIKKQLPVIMVTEKCARYMKSDIDGWIKAHRKEN